MTFESPRRTLGSRPEKIEVGGQTFSFVTRQRGDISAIYKSKETYIRIGETVKIHRDLALHRTMEAAGFPVAPILAEGQHNNEAYFIEGSLGDEHLGAIFAEDVEKEGLISDENFDHLLNVVGKFARAQLSTVSETRDFDAFSRGIWLKELCDELPEYAERLRARFEKVRGGAGSLPFVLNHGDFNPNNLYPAGVIDLEDSFYGPYGYDLISAISHIDSFPDSSEYEFFAKYRFTPEQKQRYLHNLDTISEEAGFPTPTHSKEDLEFCRAVWLAAGIPHTPKLQKYRYDFVIENFLA